jgi:hypothetical protein
MKVIGKVAAFVAIAAGCAAVVDSCRNHEKERREAAERAYRDVDDKYMDFLKLCFEHPSLDCESRARTTPIRPEDEVAQWRLDNVLVDVLEFAYKRYQNADFMSAAREAYNREWPGWQTYARKWLTRPHFRSVWCTVQDEYDTGFVTDMNKWLKESAMPACGSAIPPGPPAPVAPGALQDAGPSATPVVAPPNAPAASAATKR